MPEPALSPTDRGIHESGRAIAAALPSPFADLNELLSLFTTRVRMRIGGVGIACGLQLRYVATVGTEVRDVEFRTSICAHTLFSESGIISVNDALYDARTMDNRAVLGGFGLRSYIAAALEMDNGQRFGTLCGLDRTPARFTTADRRIARAFACEASRLIQVAARTLSVPTERPRHQAAGLAYEEGAHS